MIFEVEVERIERATVFVEADSKKEAREAGEELVMPSDFFEIDEYSDAWENPSPRIRYWSGGEQGDWIHV